MTQPPPVPPTFDPGDPNAFGGMEPQGPPRMSAAAVTGFVLSFLGCTGVAAVLGLIFGIVGIVKTKDGRRRGRGLAIAAIPISVVMGVLSILILYVALIGAGYRDASKGASLAFETPDYSEAAKHLRGAFTSEFNDRVTDEALIAWLEDIRETHGAFVEFTVDQANPPIQVPDDPLAMVFSAKFVNSKVGVKLMLRMQSLLEFKLGGIEVDGVAPRSSNPGSQP